AVRGRPPPAVPAAGSDDRAQSRLRRHARGRGDLPPARGDPPERGWLDGRGPRLDHRRAPQRPRPARRATAASWRPRRAGLDGDRLRTWMTTLAPVSVALKFG